jgi:flagella basal body P-ring formation protein FlgA
LPPSATPNTITKPQADQTNAIAGETAKARNTENGEVVTAS